jgi:hypothetical protein
MTAAKLDNEDPRVEGCMSFLSSLGIVAFAAALSITAAHAFDDSNYPAFSGIWRKPPGIGNQWDQTKPLGRAQEPPFTPEYQAIFEASLADIKEGGQGNDAPSRCVPFAMPRVMTVVFDMEIVVTLPSKKGQAPPDLRYFDQTRK